MARELMLWVYNAMVAGHHRIVLVADQTVGGAKSRCETSIGTPSGKTAIHASTAGFPEWIDGPGAWISYVPVEACIARDLLVGLDRYSQEYAVKPPSVRPDQEGAYLRAENTREATAEISRFIQALLAGLKPTELLKDWK